MATLTFSRSSAALSDASSVSSSKSGNSRRRAAYSHPLYHSQQMRCNPSEPKPDDHFDFISRFSSCSTSPNSSSESLDVISISSQRQSVTSSPLIGAARPASIRSNKSTASTYLKYADEHYPLITSIVNARENTIIPMAHAYNTYIRALNSCYNYASTITEEQIADFLFFNQTLFNILSLHLKFEQQYILPLLHTPLPESRGAVRKTMLINENQPFTNAFRSWASYIHAPLTCENFSSDVIKSQIKIFAPILVQHLHDEVSNLNALVSNGVLISKHLDRIWSKVTDSMTDSLDLYTDVALLVGCQDKEFTINGHHNEQEYPKLSMGTATMVKKWHSRKYSGAWKFCSSDFGGRRRLIQP